MLHDNPGRGFIRSGWLPATLLYALTAYLVREYAHVGGREILAFTVYAATCLTLPGTLLWRLVQRARSRPLLEDLVLGTTVGYVVELPVYLLGRAAGFPYAAALFAALVVLGSLSTPSGRRLWRLRGEVETPWTVSWSLSAVVAYTVVWLARNVWAAAPADGASLRAPYVDEPFHLALTAELRHHVPSQMPFVDGAPLFYHWFTYVHLASASWISGVEAVVLLRSVAILLMVVLTVLGVAVVSNRLSGRSWPGVAAAALLVVVPSVDVFAWTPPTASWSGSRFLSQLLYLSPTQTFAAMLSVLAVLLVWELLEQPCGGGLGAGWWPLTVLVLAALAGAKSTFLPIFLAGFAAVVVCKLLLERRLDRPAAILTGTTVVLMVGARTLLYGGGTRSLTWAPFATTEPLAHGLGLTDATRPVAPLVGAVVLLSYLASRMAGFAGAVGLLRAGGWRSGATQFVVAAVGASVAATFAFDHPGLSQFYFVASGSTLLVIGSAVGLARLFPREESAAGRHVAAAAGAALLVGAGIAVLASLSSSDASPATTAATGLSALRTVLIPQAVVVALVVLAGVCLTLLTRRRGRLGSSAGAVSGALVVCAVLGLGLPGTAAVVGEIASKAWPTPDSQGRVRAIGSGGIGAARWIRDHSAPGDLIATNAHCYAPRALHTCDRRNFWMAGYAERRVLVEGWAYIAPETVGAPSTDLTNSARTPFWDPERLRDNDRAFRAPSALDLERLRRDYGVRWLLADLRFPVRPGALAEHARLRYAEGAYRVYELR